MDTLHSPFGEFHLSRWPVRGKEELRAWNAADELLLHHFDGQVRPSKAPGELRLLVVNDEFGALGCVLNTFDVTHWSDSFVSQQALRANYTANGLTAEPSCRHSLEPLEGHFDVVLIKVPKTTAFLEDQLHRLKPHLHKDSVIIAGAMVKHLQRSAFDAFESILGSVTTSLAVKKARLLFIQQHPDAAPGDKVLRNNGEITLCGAE